MLVQPTNDDPIAAPQGVDRDAGASERAGRRLGPVRRAGRRLETVYVVRDGEDVCRATLMRAGGTLIVAVDGEVDVATAPSLRALLDRLDPANAELVIDLSQTTFIDSTAVHVITATADRLAEHGGRVRVTGAQRQVARVLQVAGIAPEGGRFTRTLDRRGLVEPAVDATPSPPTENSA